MLKSLLDPVLTPEVFFSEYWQTKPAIIERGNVHALSSVFTLADLEELFCNCIRLGDLKGESPMLVFPVPGQQHNEVRNPFFAYANRCSVVVNKADRYSLAAHRLCSALQETFPFVFCSVCVTPPRTQSVSKHSQDREILLLQVYGEKEWTIYNNPIPLPYRDEQAGKGFPIDGENLQMLTRNVVRQGDVVYIPRGFVHEGRTGPMHGSVYISVALQTSDWDYNTILLGIIQKVLRSQDMAEIGRPCVPLPLLTRACVSSSQRGDGLGSRNPRSGATSTTGSVSGNRSTGFQRQVPSSQASVASSHGMPVHHHHVHPHQLNPNIPSFKPTVISNDVVEKTNRVFANLRDALMETQEMMSSDAALHLFGGRLSALRDERDMFVRMGSAQALDLPLQPDSLICWNYSVMVGQVTQMTDPSIPSLQHTIHFFRRPPGHHGMHFATHRHGETRKEKHDFPNHHSGNDAQNELDHGAEGSEKVPEGIRRVPAMHFDPNTHADFSAIEMGSPSNVEGLGRNGGGGGAGEGVAQAALPSFQPKDKKNLSQRSISLVSNDTPPQLEITRELEELDEGQLQEKGEKKKNPISCDTDDGYSESSDMVASSPKYHLENTDTQDYSNEVMSAVAKEMTLYDRRNPSENEFFRGGTGKESEHDVPLPHAHDSSQHPNGHHHAMQEMDHQYIVSLACSEETLRTVMFLYSQHARVPCAVGSIPQQDVLSRYTIANLLLHNGCCTRIS